MNLPIEHDHAQHEHQHQHQHRHRLAQHNNQHLVEQDQFIDGHIHVVPDVPDESNESNEYNEYNESNAYEPLSSRSSFVSTTNHQQQSFIDRLLSKKEQNNKCKGYKKNASPVGSSNTSDNDENGRTTINAISGHDPGQCSTGTTTGLSSTTPTGTTGGSISNSTSTTSSAVVFQNALAGMEHIRTLTNEIGSTILQHEICQVNKRLLELHVQEQHEKEYRRRCKKRRKQQPAEQEQEQEPQPKVADCRKDSYENYNDQSNDPVDDYEDKDDTKSDCLKELSCCIARKDGTVADDDDKSKQTLVTKLPAASAATGTTTALRKETIPTSATTSTTNAITSHHARNKSKHNDSDINITTNNNNVATSSSLIKERESVLVRACRMKRITMLFRNLKQTQELLMNEFHDAVLYSAEHSKTTNK